MHPPPCGCVDPDEWECEQKRPRMADEPQHHQPCYCPCHAKGGYWDDEDEA